MAESDPHIDAIWRDVRQDFGGDSYTHLSQDLSHVLIVEDAPRPYVVKAPKEEEGAWSACLAETDICALLADVKEEPPLEVPKPLWINNNPTYAVFSYMPGISGYGYRGDELYPVDEQQGIGAATGTFIAWMETGFTHELHGKLLRTTPEHPSEMNLRKTLASIPRVRALGYRSLEAALMELHALRSICEEEIQNPPIIGHKDLHPGNIILDSINYEATGIIDFGCTGPSSPEREVRSLLAIGPEAVTAAIHAYQEIMGKELSRDLLRYWSLGRWLLNCVYWINHNQVIPPLDEGWIRTVCPDKDWSELSHWNETVTNNTLDNDQVRA